MTELEQAQAEALKYKLLFVSGVALYAQHLPPAEQQAMSDTVVAAMEAVEADWMRGYGNANIETIVLDELKKIGGQS